MNRRYLIIAVCVVSILGLAIVQYKYLEIGLNLAKLQFNTKIAMAGEAVVTELSNNNQLAFLVSIALKRDSTAFRLHIDSVQDASRHYLNDFITGQLVNNGIEADFSYELYARDSSFYLSSPREFEREEALESFPFTLRGYLPEQLNKRLVLELQFQDLNSYFLSKLNGLTLPSLLFLAGIIAVVIWVLRTYYWQRNLITHTNEFINNLTHELKTPVFSIGLATKILNEKLPQEHRPILDLIRQQVDRLTQHIDKVLELGSLEANNSMFSLERIDFYPYLLKLCEEFKTLMTIEDVDFSYDLQAGKYMLKAEVFHLENAVHNLLDNAKKYSVNPRVRLGARLESGKLMLEIRDNGVGIQEKEKSRIFQKYYRISQGNRHDVKGYGLGLSYVKQVIEKMKGKIQVESRKGEGTLFTIILPLDESR